MTDVTVTCKWCSISKNAQNATHCHMWYRCQSQQELTQC